MALNELAADPPRSSTNQEGATHLRGKVGVFELVLMVLAWSAPLGVVAGVTPFVIGFSLNGAALAFAIAGAALLIFAVGFVTMTTYVDNPGAFYAYITAGLGKAVGLGAAFLAMAGYYLLGLGTIVFSANIAVIVVDTILGGPTLPWSVYAIALCVLVGLLGYFRIDLSAKVLSLAMVLEVGLVGIFNLAVLFKGGADGLSAEPFTWDALTSGSLGLGILFAALCFSGFEATAVFREEVKDPEKTVPRATYLAVTSIGVLYVLSAYCLIIAFGTGAAPDVSLTDPAGMFPQAVGDYVGTWAQDTVTVLVATSTVAAVLSCQNILARYAYSLGVDEVLPKSLGRVHPTHGSPYLSSLAITAAFLIGTLIVIMTSNDNSIAAYSKLLGIGGFAIISLVAMTGVAIAVFFLKRPEILESRLKTLVSPAFSAVFMTIVLYLALTNFTLLTGGTQLDTVVLQGGLWLTFAVGVVLAVAYRRLKPDVYARIGRQAP